jgi:hypothetical protein
VVKPTATDIFRGIVQVRTTGTVHSRDLARTTAVALATRTPGDGTTGISLELGPLEARWLVIGESIREPPGFSSEAPTLKPGLVPRRVELSDGWRQEFRTPGNIFPAEPPFCFEDPSGPLGDWTRRPATRFFAGTAILTTVVEVGGEELAAATRIILRLGEVREVAEVIINGGSPVCLWFGDRSCDVTSLLRAGRNEVEIRVTNLLINRVIGYDRHNQSWKPRYFFVNQRYRPFRVGKHALVPSGVLGPVSLDFVAKF